MLENEIMGNSVLKAMSADELFYINGGSSSTGYGLGGHSVISSINNIPGGTPTLQGSGTLCGIAAGIVTIAGGPAVVIGALGVAAAVLPK